MLKTLEKKEKMRYNVRRGKLKFLNKRLAGEFYVSTRRL